MNTQNTTAGKYLAIIGACLQAGPIFGLVSTVVGMRKAFASLNSNGIGDTAMVSSSIGDVLVATAAGMVVGIIGVVLIIVSLFACRYRAAWFYWFLVIYGVISLFAFPVGTVIGFVFLVYSLTNRNQFINPAPPSCPPQIPSMLP